jgi:hypothetical protein
LAELSETKKHKGVFHLLGKILQTGSLQTGFGYQKFFVWVVFYFENELSWQQIRRCQCKNQDFS